MNGINRIVGIAGVMIGIVSGIYFSFVTFLRPAAPFASYDNDFIIALGYALMFTIIGVLLILQKYRWLGILSWIIVGVLLIIPLRNLTIAYNVLLIWLLWTGWVMGDVLLSWIIPANNLEQIERVVLNLVLGWGALMVLTLLFGLVGLYQRWVFLLVFILVTILGFFRLRKGIRLPEIKLLPTSWLGALVFSLMTVTAAGSYLWALAPAVRYDSLSYHLAVPMRYLEAGRMIELPESFQTYWAHYGEMLYIIALSIGEQPLPGLINFSAGILVATQTYFIGKRLGTHKTGLIGAVLLYSLPIIGIESATTYIDIFIALFVTAALHSAILWHQGNNPRWLLLLGIFCGLALGTKLNAFWLLLPFLGLVFLRLYRQDDLSWSKAAFLFLPIIFLWGPWLLRDWVWTGNPVFPNLNSIFHSPEWFDRDFYIFQPTRATLRSILLFPWLSVSDSHSYYHEAPGAVSAALPLLCLPWFYSWDARNQPRRKLLLILFLTSMVAMALLFSFGANVRYLMPLYPLLSVLAALNIEKLGNFFFQRQRFLGLGFITLGLFYVFATRLAFTVRWWDLPERYPIQIWSGRESQEQFLARVLPVYSAFDYLDQQGSFKVLSIGNELRMYTNSEIYGVFFSKDAYQLLHDARKPAELARNLEQSGFEYLLVYPPEQNHRPEIYQSPALTAEFFQRYTRLEYVQNDVSLYQFFHNGLNRDLDEVNNLLLDPGFEGLSFDGESAWVWQGAGHQLDMRPGQAKSGSIAVMMPGPSASAYQDVDVDPGQIYTIGYWVKPETEGQQIQLYVQWLDDQMQLIEKSARWLPMVADWEHYQMSATAPDQAAMARVYISLVDEGVAWFDDICFASGDVCP